METNTASANQVRLKCVMDGGKLRVRILTPGYYNHANCQFPRHMRADGRLYNVPVDAVALITSRGKYYYTVTKKSSIKLLSDEEALAEDIARLVVYEDGATDECAICMSSPKCMVIIPCGHFYTCAECTGQIKSCPVCRCVITHSINKIHMG